MTFSFAALLSAAALTLAPVAADVGTLPPVTTDHHVHVHSPEILAFLPAYCSSPGRIGACDPAFVEPLTTADLLADMDRAGVKRAFIMSTAYLAQSPMMVPPLQDAQSVVHAANAFTVAQARTHPDRLVAFVGVNPLAPGAVEEIDSWKDEPYASGLKLHLTNSGVDLRDPEQVAKLAGVFRAASRNHMAIMIHMRTRAEDYGARDVRIFLDQVLPEARGVPVMIAHSGGWGGLDDNTWAAMTAFADALEARPELATDLHFDMAQVFDDKTSPEDMARLVAIMRRIGVSHFVPGSDWPFSGALDGYFNEAMARLPLNEEEATTLRTTSLKLLRP
jgi:predicted TIM-barrel fold metal-dependent hydrolase